MLSISLETTCDRPLVRFGRDPLSDYAKKYGNAKKKKIQMSFICFLVCFQKAQI